MIKRPRLENLLLFFPTTHFLTFRHSKKPQTHTLPTTVNVYIRFSNILNLEKWAINITIITLRTVEKFVACRTLSRSSAALNIV